MAGRNLHGLVLYEFGAIVDGISDDQFYESLKKKEHNINWIKILELLKTNILSEITQEWNEMWKEENLSKKIDVLNKIKENAMDTSRNAWRPTTGNIESQTISLDAQLLKATLKHYNTIADRELERVAKLKKELATQWDDLKQHQENMKLAKKINSIIRQNISEMI